ncbi:MAG: ModE family transcriptional regulator [Candidatus Marinarcus sp.]|uniref:ModE family transcriptional regulator n=1 Tax=Candidatus Marinarcus sp. TaxID=3100987 RepID=UPI003B0026C0
MSEFQLDNTQKELLLNNLDEEGKLSCLKAFKVARLIGVKPIEMSDACESMNIKITNCELGVFGKLVFLDFQEEIYNNLKRNFAYGTDIECKVLWEEARTSTLKKVGATVKHSDIEVTHCQLGCFRTRQGKKSD